MKEDDPQAVLRELFERISSDLDRGHEASGGAPSTSVAEARKIVDGTFSSFDQVLLRKATKRKKADFRNGGKFLNHASSVLCRHTLSLAPFHAVAAVRPLALPLAWTRPSAVLGASGATAP